jgi:hypothetical protein
VTRGICRRRDEKLGLKERRIDHRKAGYGRAECRRRLDTGEGDVEKFGAQREQVMVRDHEGYSWMEVARSANVSTSLRTDGFWACHGTTSVHWRTAFWITGCSSSRPRGFSRGASYETSAHPYRYPSSISRRPCERRQIARQPAIGTVMTQPFWLRSRKEKGAKRSTRRKG